MNIFVFLNMLRFFNLFLDLFELLNLELNGDDVGWDGAVFDWFEGVVDGD